MTEGRLHRVLVAIKPSQRGLPLAAQHARSLAQSVDGRILLVSAIYDSRTAARSERGDTAAATMRARAIEAERVELERLAQSLRDWGAAVSTQVLWEAPAYGAIAHAASEWRADLVVVGVHEEPSLRTRLTDTDWQLMRHCPCPLLLVKDPSFDGYPTILAAVDPLHPLAEATRVDAAVLGIARQFARAFGSQLRTVHAYPDPDAFALASAVQVEPGVFYGVENVEELHRRAVEALVAPYGIEPAQVTLAPGGAADVLIEQANAQQAALVVLGALQRRSIGRAVLGSTAEMVAAELPCDVLLVPPPRGSEIRRE
jgi:universal stress protein E